LPGGFSYGDYLRAGAIAGRSPVVEALPEFVARGGVVLGSCNGFQILCEAGLLPGALMRNECLQYRCQSTHLLVENTDTAFTRGIRPGQVLRMPISHGEGKYHAEPHVLATLKKQNQIVLRYCTEDGGVTRAANPNGSVENIAGIVNDEGTVFGLMPHPERSAANRPTRSSVSSRRSGLSTAPTSTPGSSSPACPPRGRACCRGPARTRAPSTSATAGPSCSRSRATTTRPSSNRSRARPPASV